MAPGARLLPSIAAAGLLLAAATGNEPRLLRFKEVGGIARYLRGGKLLQELQVVQHPECAAKGRDHYRMLFRVDLYIVHPYRRQIAREGLPLPPPSRLMYTVLLVAAISRLGSSGSSRTLSMYWFPGSPEVISVQCLP